MTWGERINLASSDYAQPSEPPDLCDLIYSGKRHSLSGPPESVKTLLALILGLEHMRAGEGAWVHVDFEMGATAARTMLEDLGATIKEIRAILYYEPDGPPDLEDIEYVTGQKATFATIDALVGAYDVSALDDNKRADVERFAAAWIKPLWSRGITTLTIDHVVKNTDNRGKYAIGSERKAGGVDVHLGIEAITPLSRGTTGHFRITTHKDRPGHLPRPRAAELELVSDPDTHAITWTFKQPTTTADGSDGWRPTVLMERALEHVNRHNYEPAARTVLAQAVRGNYGYVLKAIDFLLEDGRLALDPKRKVVLPRNVPGTFSPPERNGTVSRSSSLQGGTESGTVFEPDQQEFA